MPKPTKSAWFSRLQGLTALLSATLLIGCLFAAGKGLDSLSYSNHEEYTAGICQLPTDILYKYILIGRTNELGSLAADMWLRTKYYEYESTDHMVARLGSRESSYRLKLEKVVNQNFNLHLADIRPLDKDILLTIKGYKEECSDSRRRSTFSERFNDFLHYFGIAALLAIFSWLFYQVTFCRAKV